MAKLVVIVDDEPDIAEVVSLHLKRAGFATKELVDAESFLRLIEGQSPDLIILDLILPDFDGLEICKLKWTPKFGQYDKVPRESKKEESEHGESTTITSTNLQGESGLWKLLKRKRH